MSEGIAIVGMGCRYPDARSPAELWDNVLARRRAFRLVPAERLRLEDYRGGPGGADPDSIYLQEAAVLAGWEFDRLRFKVAGRTFRAADLTHWLALEVAAAALADAGFEDGAGLPRDATGVLLGNTLTGEFARAQLLRQRWPYVRRTVGAELAADGWTEGRIADFLVRLEASYKAPFAAPCEESLAGGLSNTIAGRICNHFDLHGGGYVVDGACASSLLAVAQACTALAAGDLEVALAGGVDLSLDPFELVGFARTGALAAGEMRVYDARSSGFLPGEGCGCVVLMRERQAAAAGKRIHAVIRGWGISSDGHGGISRPEAAGQRLALARAYRRAGCDIGTVPLFEGHGTGTAVGDATELAALSQALREARAGQAAALPPAAIGSIKANIGHTKAAAGVAGLLKATQAVARGLLPPATGCDEPHPELAAAAGVPGAGPVLRVLAAAEPWPAGRPLRAGVSAMGFGGVNAHVMVEGTGTAPVRRRRLTARERRLTAPPQDVELVLLAGAGAAELAAAAHRIAAIAPRLSRAELGDLASELHRQWRKMQGGTAASAAAAIGTGGAAGGAETPGTGAEARARAAETPGTDAEARAGAGQARAAIVAATPRQLAERAGLLSRWLEQGTRRRLDPRAGIYLGVAAAGEAPPAVGLLFTGQGSPAYAGGNGREARPGGALGRRFAELAVIYELAAGLAAGGDGGGAAGGDDHGGGAAAGADTAVAQPAIVAHSLAGCWLLERLGVRASIAIGHSLGELTALCWGGACDAEAALRLAAARGRAMADQGEPGAMASLAAPAAVAAELLDGGEATIAAFNGASRTVVSGSVEAVAAVVERAAARGIAATRLKVARAFHSPRVAAAAADLDRALAAVAWQPLRRPVASTVTGAPLAPDADPRALLLAQLTSPVRFAGALAAARPFARLWIEVGPGRALAELAAEELGEPVVALDAGGPSLAGPLGAAAALFAAGLPVDLDCLFAGRFHRPFDLDRPLRFLANPCESAPLPAATVADESAAATVPGDPSASPRAPTRTASSGSAAPAAAAAPPAPEPLELVRGLVAARAELPASAVHDDSRLLGDLHLNSITVGQLVAEAARLLGLAPPASPTDYAHSTLAEVAQALAERIDLERASTAGAGAVPTSSAGRAGGLGGEASRGGGEPAAGAVPGVDTWVRPFTVALVERPLQRNLAPSRSGSQAGAGAWRVIASPDDPWAPAIAAALAALPESAGAADAGIAPDVILCLPAELDEREAAHLRLFVAAARAACGPPPARRFVVVQQGGGGAAFARTLHLELPATATWVINLPSGAGAAAAAAWVAAEVAAGSSPAWATGAPGQAGAAARPTLAPYVEAHYDSSGRRRVPLLRNLAARQASAEGAPGGDAAAGALGGGEAVAGATGDGEAIAGAALAALAPGDVLLATGGGKGIGAECALALARATGARLAILGRSDPRTDPELAATLARMAAAGVEHCYVRADAADAPAVLAAVERAAAELGPITALLHAAGANQPRRLAALDEEGLRQALAPKVAGCRHLFDALAASHPGSLRLVVGFGSLIARTGLPGEAEYALANEWLARLLALHAGRHPACRCLLVDWSVWSGTGMGERLGTMEALRREGIVPIPPDAGTAELLRLLADPYVRGEVVVTGRFGNPPALPVERPPLPLLRFLETPRVYYPGIELVVDVEVAADTDPYLSDHVFRGEPLFAAVLGLEAMAQAAAAVSGATGTPMLERIELLRPVAVPPGRSTTLRLAALVREPGRVEVALRERSTGFAADHFRALCRFEPNATRPEAAMTGPAVGPATARGAALAKASASVREASAARAATATAPSAALAAAPWPESAAAAAPGTVGAATRSGAPPSRAALATAPRLAIDPPRDLYGSILFQDGRFRRLGGYRRLLATECLAEIAADGAVGWFGRYLPPALLLGDPAARDAAIHAVQACIPHAQLLPVAVERILTGRIAAGEQLLVAARERRRDGDVFTYDLDILDAGGGLRERWLGLRLRAVDRTRLPPVWPAPLLAPYLERRLQDLLPGASLRVALEPSGRAPHRGLGGRQPSAPVIERLLARDAVPSGARRLHHRPDGRPEVPSGPAITIAHAAGLVLAVAGDGPRGLLGCDLEAIVERPAETWRDLLGAERFALAELIAGHPGERPDTAATRVWTAAESLLKAGSTAGAPLLLETTLDDGWLLLRSGDLRIASYAANLREPGGPCALAVLAGPPDPASP
jgi:enediyne polyketide synthase